MVDKTDKTAEVESTATSGEPEKKLSRKERKRLKRERRPRWLRIVRSVVGTALYLGFILGLIYFTPKMLSKWLRTPYPMAAITSSSMWPELKRGDLILIEGVALDDLQVGDVIVYTNESGAFTIHRIIEMRGSEITTKGDANNLPDPQIQYDDVVGRLYQFGDRNARVPKLGYISIHLSKFNQQ